MTDGSPVAMVEELYGELRALAGSAFRGQPAHHTLQPTALVNEVYIKLAQGRAEVRDRGHFFALAATAMRQVLVDHARERMAQKRGGDWARVTLSGVGLFASETPCDVLELDELLTALAAVNESQARIVELKVFSGLTNAEVAAAIGVSERTVERHWRFARAWLKARLGAP